MLCTGRLVIVVLFLWCWLQAVIRKVMNGPAACYRRPFFWCMRRRLARREPVTMAAKSTSMHGFPVRFVARGRSVRDGLMRVPTIVCTCLVLILSVASTEGFAQKFQEPSKEELQMTADPKAPG